MSIWEDEWEDYEMDKADFECWLDSLEGEGTPEEKYNRYQKQSLCNSYLSPSTLDIRSDS